MAASFETFRFSYRDRPANPPRFPREVDRIPPIFFSGLRVKGSFGEVALVRFLFFFFFLVLDWGTVASLV